MMFTSNKKSYRHVLLSMAAAMAMGAVAANSPAQASTLYWAPSGTVILGGGGTWDTTSGNWDTTTFQPGQLYINSDSTEAIFSGQSGTVNLNSTATNPLVAGILRQYGEVYTYTGGDLTVSDIQLANSAFATISSNIVGNPNLLVQQTDTSLSNNLFFQNNTINVKSLNVSNNPALTLPTNQLGIFTGFTNSNVTFAADANTTDLTFQVGPQAAASLTSGTTFTMSDTTAIVNGIFTITGSNTLWTGGNQLAVSNGGTLNVESTGAVNSLASLATQALGGSINISSAATVNVGQVALNNGAGQVSNLVVQDEQTTLTTNSLGIGGSSATQNGGLATATVEYGAAVKVAGTTNLWNAGDLLTVNDATLATQELVGAAGSTISLADPTVYLTNTSALTINSNNLDTFYFNGVIQNYVNSSGTQVLGGITKNGNSNFVLGGANTYSGPTIINGGTISLANPDALQNTPVTLNIANGINFNGQSSPVAGGLNGAANLNLGTTNLVLAPDFAASYSGDFTASTGGITLDGPASQTFTGGSSLVPSTMDYLIAGGTGVSIGQVVLNGGDMTLTGSTGVPLSISSNGNVTVQGGALLNLSANGLAQDANLLTITGAGTSLTGGSELQIDGNGTLNVENGASVPTLALLDSQGTNGSINISGAATVNVGKVALNNAAGQVSSLVVQDEKTTLTTNSLGIGGSSATQNGGLATATVEYGAAVTVAGTTNLWNAGDVLSVNDATFATQELVGAAGSFISLADPTVYLTNTSALTINSNNLDTFYYNGVIENYVNSSGAQVLGGITKNGNSNFVLGGANTYSGPTIINDGTISLANPLALQNTPVTLNIANGINFNNQTSAALGGLNGAVNQNIGATNVTIAGLVNNTYSGDFSATTGGITVLGIRAQIFTGGTTGAPSTLNYLAVGELNQLPATVFLNGGDLLLTGGGNTGVSGNSSLFVQDKGQLTIEGGASVTSYNTPQVDNSGSIMVTGTGSTWLDEANPQGDPLGGNAVNVVIGYTGGVSTLTVDTGGLVHSTGGLQIGGFSVSNDAGTGQVNINSGGTLLVDGQVAIGQSSILNIDGGQATVGSLGQMDTPDGLIQISDPNPAVPALTIAPKSAQADTFSDNITNAAAGPGSILYQPFVNGGSLILSGTNSYTGSTTVNGFSTLELATQTESSNFYAYNNGLLEFYGTRNTANTAITPLAVNLGLTGQMTSDSLSSFYFYGADVTGGTFSGNGVALAKQPVSGLTNGGPDPINTFNYTVFEPGSYFTVKAQTGFNQLTNDGQLNILYNASLQDVTNGVTGNISVQSGTTAIANFINDGTFSVTGNGTTVNASYQTYSQVGSTFTVGAGARWAVITQNTIVTDGKLTVDGGIYGGVDAGAHAIVTGSGTIGFLQTEYGSDVKPGDALGPTLVLNSLILGNGTMMEFNLSAPGSTANTSIKTLSTTLGNDVVINLDTNSQFTAGQYTLLTYDSLSNAADTTSWLVNGPVGFSFNISSLTGPTGAGSIFLNVSGSPIGTLPGVPEPATLALFGVGAGLLLVKRRHGKSRSS